MSEKQKHNIQIQVETAYIQEQSIPEEDRYVFAYTITIKNAGGISARRRRGVRGLDRFVRP